MKSKKILTWLVMSVVLMGSARILRAQAIGASGELKWLRINSLHTYFSEQGAEGETGGTESTHVTYSWPGEYGIDLATMRATGIWLGCQDYYSSVLDKNLTNLVVNTGWKTTEYDERPIHDAIDFRLVGKYDHPLVSVDGELATINSYYDQLDEINENLPADRMLLIKNHTNMGVTVTKKVYAFSQQDHFNYYIYDYVFKNTGIIDNDGTVNEQTIKDFAFAVLYRYEFAGESFIYQGDGNWGASNSQWGRNVVNDVVGTDPEDPDYEFRAHFAWYGPHSERPVPLEDDWGCPNQNDDGILAAAKYSGAVILHADKSATDHSDDLYQPVTQTYLCSGESYAQRASSVYDETIMAQRYEAMIAGTPELSHAEEIELSGQPANEWDSRIDGFGSLVGFGPYHTLEPGDSIHMVLAHGVAGLSREKNREVGANWLQYYNGTGTPELIMPDGSSTTNHTEYKKAWVLTCKDSLFKMFRSAITNYESGYDVPKPPPPPNEFTIRSGGDRIRLSWADNAASASNFDGYVIYRSEGSVMQPKTVYEKLWECDAGNTVHAFDDTSAVRGFDYYYYIQSKSDGSDNNGIPQYSGMFWTLTSVPAYLRRPAGSFLCEVRVVPNPYDIRARALQFGDDFQYDRIAFYGLPPLCDVKIFTERGDMIWEKYHDDGSGDELWDSLTSSGQIIVSGIYILYVEATEDVFATQDMYATHDIVADNGEIMFRKDELMYREGEQIFSKGESIYRKFVVIR